MSKSPKLFISYRRSQLVRVEAIKDALEKNGVECFLDVHDIDPLDEFPERIRTGLDNSYAFLAWWSADYAESDFCLQEFRRAWQHARRRSSDLTRRIWIVNPEQHTNHIFAGELNASNFLPPPGSNQHEWLQDIKQRVDSLVSSGPLCETHDDPLSPRLFGVPAKNSEFSGRARELMSIHNKLHPVRLETHRPAVALQTYGLGGIGKTELAIAYAHDFAFAYPGGIYWLNLAGWQPSADVKERDAKVRWLQALETTLRLDPGRLQQLTRDTEGRALDAALVREQLSKELGDKSYLWVLDNLPPLSPLDARSRILEFLLAPTANGHTLVTTRDGRPLDGFAQERLDVLTREDAIRLLARFRRPASTTESDAMQRLVDEVGAHAQALILLGEHARDYPGGYPTVLNRLLEGSRLERIERIAEALKDLLGSRARGIVATFELSIYSLDADGQRVLALASVCAPNIAIHEGLLASAFSSTPDNDAFTKAVSTILRSSLLHRRELDRGIMIHPLVADVATQLLAVDSSELRHRIGSELANRLSQVADIGRHPSLAFDIQQARILGPAIGNRLGIELLTKVARYDETRSNYAGAQSLLEQALAMSSASLGNEDSVTLLLMNDLGGILSLQGKHDEAYDLQKSAYEIYRRNNGDGDLATLAALGNLAIIRKNQGHLAEAREMHSYVLERRLQLLGDAHPSTLASMSGLAQVSMQLGDLNRARKLQEHVLVVRHLLDPENAETLSATSDLAGTLNALGEFSAAKEMLERALTTCRKLFSVDHLRTIVLMANLAGVLNRLGELKGARTLQEEILAICQRKPEFGLSHKLAAMSNLAATMMYQGDLHSSRIMQQEVLDTSREVFGKEHIRTSLEASRLLVVLKMLADRRAMIRIFQDYLEWVPQADSSKFNAIERDIYDRVTALKHEGWLEDPQ